MVSTLVLASLLARKPEGPTAAMVTQSLGATLMGSAQLVHESKLGFKPGVSLLGAYVLPGASVTLTAQLKGGQAYILTAGANDGADGVDVAFLDAEDHVIKKDSVKGAVASVGTKLDADAATTYSVTNSGSSPEFISVSILTDGMGYEIHEDNVKSIVEKVSALSKVLDNGSLHFTSQVGVWALYGSVLPQGEELKVSKLPLESANYAFLGFGDLRGKTLAMSVSDDNEKELGASSSDETAPVVELDGHSGSTTVSVLNKTGDLSLTLFTILKKG